MGGQRGLAQDLRVRLTAEQIDEAIAASSNVKAQVVGELDVLFYGKPIRQHVVEFCDLFALIGVGLALWHLIKHSPIFISGSWLLAGLVIWSLGKISPRLMHPIWKAWMHLAEKLGVVSTYLILALAWVVLVIPVGRLLKLFGISVVNMDYKKETVSYWESRDPKKEDFKLLERQF